MKFCCKANIYDEKFDFKTAKYANPTVRYGYSRLRDSKNETPSSTKKQKIRTINRLASSTKSSPSNKENKINWFTRPNNLKEAKKTDEELNFKSIEKYLLKPEKKNQDTIELFRYATEITNDEEHSAYRRMMLERLKIVGIRETEYEEYIRLNKDVLQLYIPEVKLKGLMVVINKGDFMDNFKMGIEEYEVYEEKFNLIEEKKRLIYSRPETSSLYYWIDRKSEINEKKGYNMSRRVREERPVFNQQDASDYELKKSNFMRKESSNIPQSQNYQNLSKSNPIVRRRLPINDGNQQRRLISNSPVYVPRPQNAAPLIQSSRICSNSRRESRVVLGSNSKSREIQDKGNPQNIPLNNNNINNNNNKNFNPLIKVVRRSYISSQNYPQNVTNMFNNTTTRVTNPFKPLGYVIPQNIENRSISPQNSKIPYQVQTTNFPVQKLIHSGIHSPIKLSTSSPRVATPPVFTANNSSRKNSTITRVVKEFNQKIGVISNRVFNEKKNEGVCKETQTIIKSDLSGQSEVIRTPINTKYEETGTQVDVSNSTFEVNFYTTNEDNGYFNNQNGYNNVNMSGNGNFQIIKKTKIEDSSPIVMGFNPNLEGSNNRSDSVMPGEVLFLDKIGNLNKFNPKENHNFDNNSKKSEIKRKKLTSSVKKQKPKDEILAEKNTPSSFINEDIGYFEEKVHKKEEECYYWQNSGLNENLNNKEESSYSDIQKEEEEEIEHNIFKSDLDEKRSLKNLISPKEENKIQNQGHKISFCRLNKQEKHNENFINKKIFEEKNFNYEENFRLSKISEENDKENEIRNLNREKKSNFRRDFSQNKKKKNPQEFRKIEPEVIAHSFKRNFNRNFNKVNKNLTKNSNVVNEKTPNFKEKMSKDILKEKSKESQLSSKPPLKNQKNNIKDSSILNQIMIIHGSSEFPKSFNFEELEEITQENGIKSIKGDSLQFQLEKGSFEINEKLSKMRDEDEDEEEYTLSFKENEKERKKRGFRRSRKVDTVFGKEGSRRSSRRESSSFRREFGQRA